MGGGHALQCCSSPRSQREKRLRVSVKRRNEREGSKRGVLLDNVDMRDFGSGSVAVVCVSAPILCPSFSLLMMKVQDSFYLFIK